MTEDTTAIAVRPEAPELTPFEVIERVISSGDIGKMDPAARVAFYWRTCESLGLNPMTRPFEYLNLDGKIVLYARKDATEQLRRVNRVSVTHLERHHDEAAGLYTVVAHVRLPDGREDESSGVVNTKGFSGNALANAIMKAETKAKRRATLSLVGLGFLDESEVEGIGEPVDIDPGTGEVRVPAGKRVSLLETVQRQAATLQGDDEQAETTADERPDLRVVEGDAQEVVEPVKPARRRAAKPEPVVVEAETFMSEPMTPEASAALPVDDGSIVSDEDAGAEDVALFVDDAPAPDGTAGRLSLQGLADLARVAQIGKLKFSVALDCVPADVGKRIEAMTDEERHALAVKMGIPGVTP